MLAKWKIGEFEKMKKLLITISMLLALVGVSFAQIRPQSTQTTFKDGAFSFQYINDGYDGSAAIKINDLGWNNVLGIKGLQLNGLVVNPFVNSQQNSYIGGLLNYRAYSSERFSFNLGVGLKGVDISSLLQNGNFDGIGINGTRQFVWSVGFTFKL